MKPVHVLVLGLAVAVMWLAVRPPLTSSSTLPWPTARWMTSAPEQQGIDSSRLAATVDALRASNTDLHSLTVVRNGRLVLDVGFFPYHKGDMHDLASVTKSVVATLVGAALQDGRISSVTQPVGSLLGSAARPSPQLRIEDLLTMRSGLAWSDDDEAALDEMRKSPDWVEHVLALPLACEPGTRYVYCSGGMHVLSGVLSRVTGESAAAYARHRVFEPLGIGPMAWVSDGRGVTTGWGDLHLQPADAARLGLLWLNRGQWDGRAILSAAWMEEATRPRSRGRFGGYGYGFWLDEQARPTRFLAMGRGGQHVTVVPSRNLVIVVTGGGVVPSTIDDDVIAALVSDEPLPDNPAGALRLAAAVEASSHPPTPVAVAPLPARAARVSGIVYRCPPNAMTLQYFRLRFDGSAVASADMKWRDFGTTHPTLGLDGVTRITPGGRHGLPVGLKGAWESDDIFILEYDEIANINHYRLRIRFSDPLALVEMSERTLSTRASTFAAKPVPAWPEDPRAEAR